MIECVNDNCDYFKQYGECSSVCIDRGIKKIVTNFDRLHTLTVDEFIEELYLNIPDEMNLQFIFGSWRNKKQIKEWLLKECDYSRTPQNDEVRE